MKGVFGKNVFGRLLALVVVCSAANTLFAQEQDLIADHDYQILYHEPLPELTLASGVGALQAEPGAGEPAGTMSFEAFGRRFDLILESNDQVIANLPEAQKSALAKSVKLYRGRVDGLAGSWVRLTRSEAGWSGMIWDGTEAYIVDPADQIATRLAAGASGGGALIYRLADTVWDNATCAVDPNAAPVNDYSALVGELQALTTALPAANRQLDMAIVADAQFVQDNSANPNSAVIARMNVVDGIYSEQVGVRINVTEIRNLQNNGSLSSTNSSTLLNQFASFSASSALNNPGLAHLFTNRNLNGGVIGIAFLGSLCSNRNGVGVSETRGTGTAGSLTVAHEIGHNFGAPHDNQGRSVCSSTPNGFLMNPFANGADTFSQCSLDTMAPNIANARCITEVALPPDVVPNPDVRVILPLNPLDATAGTSFDYAIEIRSDGGIAANVVTVISTPAELQVLNATVDGLACIDDGIGNITCDSGTIGADASSTITLNLLGNIPGSFVSNISVTADNDDNPGNNTAQATINVNGVGSGLFESDFNADTGGFVFVDDPFRNTLQPNFSRGDRLVNGGFTGAGLRVVLGGINNATILNMSGGWRRAFTLATPQQVTMSFRVRLLQSRNYESDEFSDAMVSVDGIPLFSGGNDFLARLRGNGNGGATRLTNWLDVEADLGVLAAGPHAVTIGGFNNKKTFNDELTVILIDDVVAQAAAGVAVEQPRQGQGVRISPLSRFGGRFFRGGPRSRRR